MYASPMKQKMKLPIDDTKKKKKKHKGRHRGDSGFNNGALAVQRKRYLNFVTNCTRRQCFIVM